MFPESHIFDDPRLQNTKVTKKMFFIPTLVVPHWLLVNFGRYIYYYMYAPHYIIFDLLGECVEENFL